MKGRWVGGREGEGKRVCGWVDGRDMERWKERGREVKRERQRQKRERQERYILYMRVASVKSLHIHIQPSRWRDSLSSLENCVQ